MNLVMVAALVVLGGPPAKPIDVVHHVSGNGTIQVAPNDAVTFEFDAGESNGVATGTARFSSASGFGFSMDVDCISVVGSTAWLSGILTSATYPLAPGQSAVFEIVDGSPDQICRPITGQNSPCTDRAQHALYSLVTGNVQVR